MEPAGSGATWTGSPKGGFSGRKHHKPRQGVVPNTLNLFRNGAVGFIDWLGPRLLEPYFSFVSGADVKGLMQHTINDDDLVSGFALGVCGGEIESMWIAEPPPTLPPLVGAVPGIG